MTDLKKCDICQQIVDAYSTYQVSIKKVNSKANLYLMPKNARYARLDVCHECISNTILNAIDFKLMSWKIWNKEESAFEDVKE